MNTAKNLRYSIVLTAKTWTQKHKLTIGGYLNESAVSSNRVSPFAPRPYMEQVKRWLGPGSMARHDASTVKVWRSISVVILCLKVFVAVAVMIFIVVVRLRLPDRTPDRGLYHILRVLREVPDEKFLVQPQMWEGLSQIRRRGAY